MNSIKRIDDIRNSSGDLTTHQLRDDLQRTMQQHAAVFREQDTLAEGCVKLDVLAEKVDRLGISVRLHLSAHCSACHFMDTFPCLSW